MITYGFIGAGHIVETLAGGILAGGEVARSQIICSDISEERRKMIGDRLKVRTTGDNEEVVREADVILLAVPPQAAPQLLRSLGGRIPRGKLVVSIMAGVPLSALNRLGEGVPVVRAGANPPARVGEALTALVPNERVTPGDLEIVKRIAHTIGRVVVTDETKLDIIMALFSPAPVYLFAESLVDAGVRAGLTRKESETVVLQTMYGCMKMWAESDCSVGDLRAQACTPGGVSVEMIHELEREGIRGVVSDCVMAGVDKCVRLGREAARGI
ncbi:MAG: pyrroline-5-carboxylate reductase family protein [Ignavibacteriales bacterium]